MISHAVNKSFTVLDGTLKPANWEIYSIVTLKPANWKIYSIGTLLHFIDPIDLYYRDSSKLEHLTKRNGSFQSQSVPVSRFYCTSFSLELSKRLLFCCMHFYRFKHFLSSKWIHNAQHTLLSMRLLKQRTNSCCTLEMYCKLYIISL